MRSKNKLIPGKWYTLSIDRRMKSGQMKLSSETDIVFGKSQGRTRGLNIRSPIYFGGINRNNCFEICFEMLMMLMIFFVTIGGKYSVSSGVGVDRGFDGCITDLKVGNQVNQVMDFNKAVVEASNVNECSLIDQMSADPCSRQPCQHGAQCNALDHEEYVCLCEKGFRYTDPPFN
jgi:hypothetical protein